MTQISTPQPQGPSSRTIEFIRKFARNYQPQTTVAKSSVMLYDAPKTLGEC